VLPVGGRLRRDAQESKRTEHQDRSHQHTRDASTHHRSHTHSPVRESGRLDPGVLPGSRERSVRALALDQKRGVQDEQGGTRDREGRGPRGRTRPDPPERDGGHRPAVNRRDEGSHRGRLDAVARRGVDVWGVVLCVCRNRSHRPGVFGWRMGGFDLQGAHVSQQDGKRHHQDTPPPERATGHMSSHESRLSPPGGRVNRRKIPRGGPRAVSRELASDEPHDQRRQDDPLQERREADVKERDNRHCVRVGPAAEGSRREPLHHDSD
jgi:hypothetical protein